jgi:hypothetical protein
MSADLAGDGESMSIERRPPGDEFRASLETLFPEPVLAELRGVLVAGALINPMLGIVAAAADNGIDTLAFPRAIRWRRCRTRKYAAKGPLGTAADRLGLGYRPGGVRTRP